MPAYLTTRAIGCASNAACPARARGVSVHADSSVCERARKSTSSTSTMNITRMFVPGSSVEFANTRTSRTPNPTPPTIVSVNDVIRPTSAAVSAKRRRLGPSATLTSPAIWFSTGAASSALTEASTPARIHTCVDTDLTRMPDSDAAPGLSDADRTDRPKRVRCRRNARNRTINGTAMSTIS